MSALGSTSDGALASPAPSDGLIPRPRCSRPPGACGGEDRTLSLRSSRATELTGSARGIASDAQRLRCSETARSELGRSASCRLSPWNDECAENPDGQQELQVGRETPRAVPAEAVVKESSCYPDAGRGRRARGRVRNWPLHQASPDRVGLAARRGEGRLRRRSPSQGDASGSPGAVGGRPRGGGSAPAGAPQVATCSPRRRRRPWPHEARRSRLPFLADCARRGYPTSARSPHVNTASGSLSHSRSFNCRSVTPPPM